MVGFQNFFWNAFWGTFAGHACFKGVANLRNLLDFALDTPSALDVTYWVAR